MSQYLQYFSDYFQILFKLYNKDLEMWGEIISFEQKKPATNRVGSYRDIKFSLSRGNQCDYGYGT